MTREEVTQSLLQKLASEEIFTDAELTVLHEDFLGAANTKTASAPEVDPEQEQLQKIAEALNGLEIDEAVFNDAMNLSPEKLAQIIEQVYESMPQEVSELILEKAAHDVDSMVEEQRQIDEQGERLGRAMFHGFNKEAAAYAQQEQVEETAEDLREVAPSIAAALGY